MLLGRSFILFNRSTCFHPDEARISDHHQWQPINIQKVLSPENQKYCALIINDSKPTGIADQVILVVLLLFVRKSHDKINRWKSGKDGNGHKTVIKY